MDRNFHCLVPGAGLDGAAMKTLRETLYHILGWYQAWCRGTEQAVLAQAQLMLDEGRATPEEARAFFESHGFIQPTNGEQK